MGDGEYEICKSYQNRNGGLTVYEWLHLHETAFQGMHYLCNFAKSPSFLSEVDDNPASTFLCLFHGFFDAENEVWATRADVRSEHVTSITL